MTFAVTAVNAYNNLTSNAPWRCDVCKAAQSSNLDSTNSCMGAMVLKRYACTQDARGSVICFKSRNPLSKLGMTAAEHY